MWKCESVGFEKAGWSLAHLLPNYLMNLETWIGLTASSLTTISLLPQLIKIARERKAEHISFPWLVILFAGLCFWIYYGLLKKDFIIIISNLVSALINLTIGILGFIIMRRKASSI